MLVRDPGRDSATRSLPPWPTGNRIAVDAVAGIQAALVGPPESVARRLIWTRNWEGDGPFAGALIEGGEDDVRKVTRRIAALPEPLVLAQSATSAELASGASAYCLSWLLEEVSTSINTGGGRR
ncbi:hypothetical protein [Amaricoccus sp.]|uniref:hypothetical protein n=1 Tax=Amaricoccus sp. TaxID=1872485 RepID=UPI001B55BC13|nr:hypothetical protein [Amaricoccus sp.]MBP7002679.1 hypothetical protein [Amaricoccus sp.]